MTDTDQEHTVHHTQPTVEDLKLKPALNVQ